MFNILKKLHENLNDLFLLFKRTKILKVEKLVANFQENENKLHTEKF